MLGKDASPFGVSSELSYYEAVPGATGEYARYETCHALCFQTSEEKVINNVLIPS